MDSLWWLLWLFVIFAPYEIYAAISKKKGDTLSEHVWDWFGVRSKRRWAPLRRFLLAQFLVTLTYHLVMGWPGGWAIIVTGTPVGFVILYAEWENFRDALDS